MNPSLELDLAHKNFKANLKKLKIDKGLTTAKLSKLSGIKLNRLYRIEFEMPSFKVLVPLARFFEVSLDDLLFSALPGASKEGDWKQSVEDLRLQITAYQDKHKLSQGELAKKLGTSIPTAAKLQKGHYHKLTEVALRVRDKLTELEQKENKHEVL